MITTSPDNIHVNKLPNLGLHVIIKDRRRRLWESIIMRTYRAYEKLRNTVQPDMKRKDACYRTAFS